MENPFHYGAPATGQHFIGRTEELEALLGRIRNGINVVVISPRRYGKTSLLLRAEESLSAKRPRPAIVSTNVFVCRDLATLASRLVSGAYRVPVARWHRAGQALAEFLQRIRVRPTVELDETGKPRFRFEPGLASTDADQVITDVFRILAEQAEARPTALVLDEFQAITRHGEHLPFLLKGLSDEYPGVSLVLAGSQRHLMERLVTSEAAPLYGMAQRLALGPIPDAEMMDYLQGRARDTGKRMDPAAARRIVELAGPVPNDIQHLAFEAFEVAGKTITRASVEDGMRRAVTHESDLYAVRVEHLSEGQLRVLVSLAVGPTGPIFANRFARQVGLAGGQSVKKAIDALSQDETVIKRDGQWVVGDPFLAAWLRQAT